MNHSSVRPVWRDTIYSGASETRALNEALRRPGRRGVRNRAVRDHSIRTSALGRSAVFDETRIKAELLSQAPRQGVALREAIGDLCDLISRGEPIIKTLPTRLELLDDTTGGLVRGEYAGLVGPPGVAKSTVADQIMVGVGRRDCHPSVRRIAKRVGCCERHAQEIL